MGIIYSVIWKFASVAKILNWKFGLIITKYLQFYMHF